VLRIRLKAKVCAIPDGRFVPVVKRADELLAERGQHPLPGGVSPLKLRHTFASVPVASGGIRAASWTSSAT